MNTYVVGDLQGCVRELHQLLDALRFDPGQDELWLVGDLINRGPDSLACLRLARALGASCVAVLGNHDLSVLAQLLARKPPGKLKRTAREIAEAPDAAELLQWLQHRPLAHRDGDHLMIHAGLPPQWTASQALEFAGEVEDCLRGPQHPEFFDQMYGDEPAVWRDDLTGMDRLRFITNCLTRLRYCDAAGCLALSAKLAPAQTGDGLQPWFALPQRRSRDVTVLFGHWSTLGQIYWPAHRVWGLDTGCVWGGRMTALHLQSYRLFQAPSPGHKKPGGG